MVYLRISQFICAFSRFICVSPIICAFPRLICGFHLLSALSHGLSADFTFYLRFPTIYLRISSVICIFPSLSANSLNLGIPQKKPLPKEEVSLKIAPIRGRGCCSSISIVSLRLRARLTLAINALLMVDCAALVSF